MNAPITEPDLDELVRQTENDGYELVDGKLVERQVGALSTRVAARLIGLLEPFATSNGLGTVLASECGYQIFPKEPKRVRKPDISFVAVGRLPNNDEPPPGHLKIVPDLIVEVVSPNDLADELEARVADYLSAGVPMIWVIFPPTRTAWIFGSAGGAHLSEQDALDGGSIIPGFTCPLASLFVKPSDFKKSSP